MTYTVKPGDTISGILKKLGVSSFASPQTWALIKTRSGNPSRIFSGEILDLSGVPGLAPQPQQAPAPVVNPGQAAGEAQAVNFDEVLPWEQYYDKNLARSSAEQTAAAYYAPMAQKERSSLETGFANRGLTRSGQRGTAVMDLYGNLAQRQQSDIDQDVMGMESDARQERQGFQELYERTGGKQKPASAAYEGYNRQAPQLSAGRYGTSYQNWINSVLGGLN